MTTSDQPERAAGAPEESGSDDSKDDLKIVAQPPRAAKSWTPRWQWSLMTLLLLTAVVAAWSATWRISTANRHLQLEVDAMRSLAGELVVTDPNQFAVVEKPELWHEEHRWEVHLPEGGPDRLNLATHEVPADGLPDPELADTTSTQLESGRHLITLDQVQLADGRWRLTVEVDGEAVLTRVESWDRNAGGGPFTPGVTDRTRHVPTDSPLILYRKPHRPRRVQATMDSEPKSGDGILLWFDARK